MPDVDLERELDALFCQPPERFVAVRTGLVRDLKAAGRTEDVDRIKGWRRPARAVWALNHLALTANESIAPVVVAASRVAALQANGGPGLRDAVAELRKTTHRATDAAVRALPSARPSDSAEVAAVLSACVADPAALEVLGRGRLLQVPEPSLSAFGFGADGPAAPAPSTPKRRVPRTRADQKEDVEARRRAIAAAEAAVASATEAHAHVRSERDAADAALERSLERVERAQRELEAAEAEAEAARTEGEVSRTKEAAAAAALTEAQRAVAALGQGPTK